VTRKRWEKASSAGAYLLKVFFSPAVLIAIFTPLVIHGVNRIILAAAREDQAAIASLRPLIDAMSNGSWACATLDVKIQVYATAVAFFIAIVDWGRSALSLHTRIQHLTARAQNTTKLLKLKLLGISGGAVYFVLFIACAIYVVITLNPEMIALYKPTCGTSQHPPFTSLTFLRYSILIGTVAALYCKAAQNEHRVN
jgi:hypothetical protein